MRLRIYQEEGVQQIREAYASGNKRVLYVLPTGGGKSAVLGYVASSAAKRGNSVIILVHRQELLLQLSETLRKFDTPHGLIAAGFPQSPLENIQVASVQTIVRRLSNVKPPSLIVVDEAHHALSKSYQAIAAHFPSAKILGVTATPCRTNGQGLIEVFDRMVVGPSSQKLTEMGNLCSAEFFAPPVMKETALHGISTSGGDYNKGELGAVMNTSVITGCAVGHYQKYSAGKPAIAFCVSIDHAEAVAATFRASGVRAVRVDGKMKPEERRAAIQGLASGEYDLLTTADLIGEGVDIPRVTTAILLRPTKSLSLYLQQVGRALRPAEGKDKAIILDHVGNWRNHGLPHDDRNWSLEGVEKKDKAEKGITIRQCKQCYAVYEGRGECPECGYGSEAKGREIQEVEGELLKLDTAALNKERDAAQTFEDLRKIEKKRGYKSGWAWNVIQARHRKKSRG